MELYNHESTLELKLDLLRIEWHLWEVGPSRPLKLMAILVSGILVENLKKNVFLLEKFLEPDIHLKLIFTMQKSLRLL